jgi:ketosteroid isomerase-like protein
MLKDAGSAGRLRWEPLIKEGSMTGTAVHEIFALEDSLTQATRALDLDALDRIYADDIIMTSVLGEPCGKAVVLDEARRGLVQRQGAAAVGKPITSSYDKEDLKVSAGSDVAVASYRFVVRIQADGIDVNRRYRTTNVWMKRQGRWQIVAAHTGFVLSPKQAASLAGEVS